MCNQISSLRLLFFFFFFPFILASRVPLTLIFILVYLLLAVLLLSHSSEGANPDLKSQWFTIPETFSMKAAPAPNPTTGPKGIGAPGSFATRGAPCPLDAAVIYWSEWELFDPENNNTVYEQGNSIFFHHIMLYDRGNLVTGSSDERSSFGVQFNDNSKYAWMTDQKTVVAGGMYVVNFLPRPVKFKIRYKIKWYEKTNMPDGMRPAILRAFFTSLSVPAFPADKSATYPPGQLATNSKPFNLQKPLRLLSTVGHGHIGGKSMNVYNGNELVCESVFKYHDGNVSDTGPRISHFIPAFIELPRDMRCQAGHKLSQYPALRYIQQCDFSDRDYDDLPVLKKNARQVAKYDKICQWQSAHCQTYNWVVKE